MRIVDVRQVRESSAAMQRRESAKAVEAAAEPIEAYYYKEAAVSAPPGEEPVAGSDGQPSKAAPSTPADAYTPSTSEAEE
jgi:hypothetical protein